MRGGAVARRDTRGFAAKHGTTAVLSGRLHVPRRATLVDSLRGGRAAPVHDALDAIVSSSARG
jgi:hypothetical protein